MNRKIFVLGNPPNQIKEPGPNSSELFLNMYK